MPPDMPTETEPIARRRLSDEVADRLKRKIMAGGWRPGDRLPSERELMRLFGVGRPAVREALQALASMGLLALSHGERARVLELTARSVIRSADAAASFMLHASPASLEHLKAARLFFERGMVRQAALRAGPVDIADLRAIIARQRAALGDTQRFITADMDLHIRIAALTGNPIYEAASEAMLGWLRRYHVELLVWSGKERYTLAEHARIVDLLAARDPDGAEAAMTAHLERSAVLYAHPPGEVT
jgi:DNA-binding FadR family transcriptional regulator